MLRDSALIHVNTLLTLTLAVTYFPASDKQSVFGGRFSVHKNIIEFDSLTSVRIVIHPLSTAVRY